MSTLKGETTMTAENYRRDRQRDVTVDDFVVLIDELKASEAKSNMLKFKIELAKLLKEDDKTLRAKLLDLIAAP
jgi:hypothetical protein